MERKFGSSPSGLLLSDGILIGDGTVFGDGLLMSDGLLVSDGFLLSDSYVQSQSAMINGDDTTFMHRSSYPESGIIDQRPTFGLRVIDEAMIKPLFETSSENIGRTAPLVSCGSISEGSI